MISEVVLLTKCNYLNDFIEWINYYKKLGFNNLVVYDNESTVDIKTICESNHISYKLISGYPDQINLYTNHFKNSTADWVYFADDDEFLWFDFKKYKNVNQLITAKITELNCDISFGVFWVKLSSNIVLNLRDDLPDTTQIKTFKYRQIIEDESWCKCFYNTKYKNNITKIDCHILKWDNTEPPKIKDTNGTLIVSSTEKYKIIGYTKLTTADCKVYHYYHKSWNEWYTKVRRLNAATGENNSVKFATQQYDDENKYKKLLSIMQYNTLDLNVFNILYE